jgi:hypothetical protein
MCVILSTMAQILFRSFRMTIAVGASYLAITMLISLAFNSMADGDA